MRRLCPRPAIFWGQIGTYCAATVVAVYLLAPVVWLVISSIMPEFEVLSVPPHWIPEHPTLDNYLSFFASAAGPGPDTRPLVANWFLYMRNSLIVAASVAAVNIVFGTMAAYSLARLDFRWSRPLVLFYLASRMVPGVAIMIPLFLIMKTLDLLDSKLSMIIAYTSFTLPFTVWILRSYFQTVPRDLEDAARVDGCGWLKMMILIFLPVTMPAVTAAGMFCFLDSWGEFIFAVVFTSSPASQTVPIGVSKFATEIRVEKTLMATAGILAIIPPVVLALIFQRLIVQGLLSGSTKG